MFCQMLINVQMTVVKEFLYKTFVNKASVLYLKLMAELGPNLLKERESYWIQTLQKCLFNDLILK